LRNVAATIEKINCDVEKKKVQIMVIFGSKARSSDAHFQQPVKWLNQSHF